ncbi:hypothetical protein Goklo_003053 [Gossypium klotzschianum]|uniref:Uncharacterized protein n=1 Tax=Gossypium klotzschianum TaxID=34286 RepID=A0A7J8VV44_9ROSI|nr:hypothetical protein [Gossypium klotzschianum]
MQRFPRAGQRLASSAKAEGTLTTRSTRRVGMKVDLHDPTVLSARVCHLDVGSSPPGAIVCPKGWIIHPLKQHYKRIGKDTPLVYQKLFSPSLSNYGTEGRRPLGTPRNKSNRDEVGPIAHRIRARGYEPRARGSNPSSPTTSQKGKDRFSLGIGKS